MPWRVLERDPDRVERTDGSAQVAHWEDGRAALVGIGVGYASFPRVGVAPYLEPGWPARLVADMAAANRTDRIL